MDIYEFLDEANRINLEWLKSRITQIIVENETIFVDMIRSQWERGENEDEKPVGIYKPVTENFYAKLNPPSSGMPKKAGQPYNMIWDGDLIRLTNIDLEVKDNELILTIDSSGSSKKGLFERIRKEGLVHDPESIFGLQEFNLGKLTETTEDQIVKNFLRTLKLE